MAFSWVRGGKAGDLGDLPGDSSSEAYAINKDNEAVAIRAALAESRLPFGHRTVKSKGLENCTTATTPEATQSTNSARSWEARKF
jgi:uncharacterized membrane protein